MPTSNVTAYIDYFRQLARRHVQIGHDPASETADSDIGKKRFTAFGAEEVVNGLRSKVSFPALLIELYETNTSAEVVYDIRRRPKGTFMVVDTALVNDFADEERAYTLCEKIVDDLLKQIWQDHYGPDKDRCTTPFKEFRWNTNIMPVGRIFTNEFGYYVEFDFDFHNTTNISEPPAAGTFID